MTEKVPCKECGTLVLYSTIAKTEGRCMPCFKKEYPFWPLHTSKFMPSKTKDEVIKLREQHLAELDRKLFDILEKETKSGNNILETFKGWPKPGSIFVMLEKPFIKKNEKLPLGIIFREVNDQHFWKEEYLNEKSVHILACRF